MTDEMTTDPTTPPVAAVVPEEAVEAAGYELFRAERNAGGKPRNTPESMVLDAWNEQESPDWGAYSTRNICLRRARAALTAALPHLHVQPTPGVTIPQHRQRANDAVLVRLAHAMLPGTLHEKDQDAIRRSVDHLLDYASVSVATSPPSPAADQGAAELDEVLRKIESMGYRVEVMPNAPTWFALGEPVKSDAIHQMKTFMTGSRPSRLAAARSLRDQIDGFNEAGRASRAAGVTDAK